MTPGIIIQYFPDGSGIGVGYDPGLAEPTAPHPFTVAIGGPQSATQRYGVTNGYPLTSPASYAGRVHAASYWGMSGATILSGQNMPALVTSGYINWPLGFVEEGVRCENLQWGDIVIPSYFLAAGSEGGLQVIEDVWDAGASVFQRVRNVASGAVSDEKLWDWGFCSTTTTTTSTTTSTTTTTTTTTSTTTEAYPDYYVWLQIAIAPGSAGLTRLAVPEVRDVAL